EAADRACDAPREKPRDGEAAGDEDEEADAELQVAAPRGFLEHLEGREGGDRPARQPDLPIGAVRDGTVERLARHAPPLGVARDFLEKDAGGSLSGEALVLQRARDDGTVTVDERRMHPGRQPRA